jgi:hypothetical protein
MFRFTIRDVLLLIALLGVTLAWWQDHRKLAAETERVSGERAKFEQAFNDMTDRHLRLEAALRERGVWACGRLNNGKVVVGPDSAFADSP